MRAALIAAAMILTGCSSPVTDPNAVPTYGENTGLPKNCRAIIMDNVRRWRAGEFTAEESMESIDRNCGEHGYSWGQ